MTTPGCGEMPDIYVYVSNWSRTMTGGGDISTGDTQNGKQRPLPVGAGVDPSVRRHNH